MLKFINLLAIVSGMIMAIISLYVSSYFSFLGIALMMIGFVSDRSRAKRKAIKSSEDALAYFDQLKDTLSKGEHTLIVYRRKWPFIVSAIGAGLSSWAIHFQVVRDIPSWSLLGIALFFVIIFNIHLFLYLSNIGKPTIIFSKEGFTYFSYDFIPWKKVTDGSLESGILNFKVSSYNGKIHALEYLLCFLNCRALRREIVRLNLQYLTESPIILNSIAFFLWKEAVELPDKK